MAVASKPLGLLFLARLHHGTRERFHGQNPRPRISPPKQVAGVWFRPSFFVFGNPTGTDSGSAAAYNHKPSSRFLADRQIVMVEIVMA